ncbi:MAG TPA: LysR substrate-binding domain-containing protein, partial [Kiloniellaceae bacterium]|nr:LysR substrate-binding domain-containing protein [Kiloniellaceae bacterium]
HHKSATAAAILENRVFCVNVLRDDQSHISDTFAGRFKDQVTDKFDCASWTTETTGAPRVVDPLVAFDCRLLTSDRVGTHYVLLGEVEHIFVADKGSPLIYANRAYGAAVHIEAAKTVAAGMTAAERKLAVACHLSFEPYILPQLIAGLEAVGGPVELDLIEGDQRRVQSALLSGEAELGLLYDLDLPEELEREPLQEMHPYVLLADGHPLTARAVLAPADLAEQPMILLNAPSNQAYVLDLLREAGVEPRVAYKSISFEMVRGLVGQGLGYALLTTKPASPMTYDGLALTARPLRVTAPPNQIVLAYRKCSGLSKAATAFAELCREVFDR